MRLNQVVFTTSNAASLDTGQHFVSAHNIVMSSCTSRSLPPNKWGSLTLSQQKSVPPVDKCKDPQHAADKAECAAIEFADEKRAYSGEGDRQFCGNVTDGFNLPH